MLVQMLFWFLPVHLGICCGPTYRYWWAVRSAAVGLAKFPLACSPGCAARCSGKGEEEDHFVRLKLPNRLNFMSSSRKQDLTSPRLTTHVCIGVCAQAAISVSLRHKAYTEVHTGTRAHIHAHSHMNGHRSEDSGWKAKRSLLWSCGGSGGWIYIAGICFEISCLFAPAND